MALELDHLFVFTTPGAPELEKLLAIGLVEGTANVHPGQGTQNRRIFFHNAMLELLWVRDEAEVRSPAIAPTRLWERSRYRETGYSPFGVSLRWANRSEVSDPLPFATWDYQPPYLPPHLTIPVVRDTAPGEPMTFVIPFGGRPDQVEGDRRQPLDHPCAVQEITALRLTVPSEPLSAPMQVLQTSGLVTFQQGPEPLAELEFDHGTQGQMVDLRPGLPLCLRW